MDMKLELVLLPVADVDRAKAFYTEQLGFKLDHDVSGFQDMRVVQLTPPGSACSIAFGTGIVDTAPGAVQGLHLVVADINAVRAELASRGVAVGEVQDLGGILYVSFSDPDGNGWLLQEIPGRGSQRNTTMGKVIFANSMSLDGFVAGPNDSPEQPLGEGGERLFHWYYNGDTALPLPGTDMVFHVARASAELLREEWRSLGAMVAGRRMFDIAQAWGGNPPGGGPCFIVTHTPPQEWVKEGSPFTFVTDGVESAIQQAKAVAGDKNVSVSSASILQQCLKAGLLDEIHIDLVPVLLGGGVRLFDHLDASIELERTRVVEGVGVTHLTFRVVK